jgi:hypothetical protein
VRISNLTDVDGDEVSLVRRAANRRRFLLLKGDQDVDSELSDILDVPWEREGAMLDELRKDGVVDETVEKAFVTAVRLLKGIEGEFSPELIEKLGREMYPVQNNPLNSTKVASPGELSGSASGDESLSASATDGELSGGASGSSLEGRGSGAKVAADSDGDTEEPDDDEDDKKKRPWMSRKKKAVSKSDDHDDDEGGTVEFRVPVQKEDGTWDYSDVPEESHSFFKTMIEKAEKADQIEKSLGETREQLLKSQDELRQRDYIAKAEKLDTLAPADKLGLVLKNAAETMDADRFAELEQVLTSAQARVQTGDLFKELGARALEDETSMVAKSDPWSQIEALAKTLVEKSGELTEEQAIARVLKTAEGKELYTRYERDYLASAAAMTGFGGAS